MEMNVALLAPDAARWPELLARVEHDFYHLPSYAELSARTDGGEARALVVDDGERTLLLPFVRRAIPGTEALWDGTSPYGYPGPLVTGATGIAANDFASAALDAAGPRLRAEGGVSLFVRLHPLLGALPRPSSGTLVQHGETVFVDLARTEQAHWSETMSGHRNEINRAVRAGHRVVDDPDFAHVDRFVEIYQSTMQRVGAAAFYFFDRGYVLALREALGPRLQLAFVEIDGTLAAGGLFVRTGSMVQYHLSGTDAAFARFQPTKLLLHTIRGRARERGDRYLHLGGGVGGKEDSLHRFKAGFSKGRVPFHTLRLLLDPERYATLSRARRPDLGATLDHTAFFPLYRSP